MLYTYFISVWVIDHLYESLLMYLKSSFFFNRSQTKLREGNVLHLSVILFTGGRGCTPPGHTHSPGHTHPWTHTPIWTSPRLDTHPGHRRPCTHIPPLRSTSGRYASYWNAFWFLVFFCFFVFVFFVVLLIKSIVTIIPNLLISLILANFCLFKSKVLRYS